MRTESDGVVIEALHEKGLQGYINVGTLVSSQERRPLFALVINRLSTTDFVPPSVMNTT